MSLAIVKSVVRRRWWWNQNPSCLPTRSQQPTSTLGEQRPEKPRLLTRSLSRIDCSSSCRDLGACWWRLVEILRRDCRSRAFVRDPWRSQPCSALCSARIPLSLWPGLRVFRCRLFTALCFFNDVVAAVRENILWKPQRVDYPRALQGSGEQH